MMLHTCAVCTPLSAQAAKILRGAGACSRPDLLELAPARVDCSPAASLGVVEAAARAAGRGPRLNRRPFQSSIHLPVPPLWRPGRAGAAAEGRAGSGAGQPAGNWRGCNCVFGIRRRPQWVFSKTGVCDVTVAFYRIRWMRSSYLSRPSLPNLWAPHT